MRRYASFDHRCELMRVCDAKCRSSSTGYLPRTHRRAWSAPPKISTVSGRVGRTDMGKEIEDEGQTYGFDSFNYMGLGLFDSYFCHASFEVIARSLPAHKIQELERILKAFAASLKPEGSPSSHHQEARKYHEFDTPHKKNSNYVPDPRYT